MATEKTLETLFHDTLKDIYYAERKIVKALPKMARAAKSAELKAAFEKHRDETEGQIERLQKVFELLGKRAQGKTCEATDGILAEGDEIAEDYKGTVTLDAGLISSAQAVEHYEITRYGTLKRWATQLGMREAADLLDQTLQEEYATDDALTALAESSANITAEGSDSATAGSRAPKPAMSPKSASPAMPSPAMPAKTASASSAKGSPAKAKAR